VSVFFDLGNAAMAIGNVGLVYAVLCLQIVVVWSVFRFRQQPDTILQTRGVFRGRLLSIMGQLRCPSLTAKASSLLLPGSVLGITAAFCSSSTSAGDTGICVVACLLVLAIIGAHVAVQRLAVLPSATLTPYRVYVVGTVVERRFLFPEARWEPIEVNQAFSPLMSPMQEGYSLLLVVELLLACFVGLVSGAYIGGACSSPLLAIASSLYLLYGLALAVLRPYRLPVDRVCAPAVNVLLGVLCALQYSDTRNSARGAEEALQIVASVLQVLRGACSLYIVIVREGQLRRGDPAVVSPGASDEVSAKPIDLAMLMEPSSAEELQDVTERREELDNDFDEGQEPLDSDEAGPPQIAASENYLEPALLLLDDGTFWDDEGRAVVASSSEALAHGDNDLLLHFSERDASGGCS
jgi:hypothetical protein